MLPEAPSTTLEPVFILIDADHYADDEKKRVVITRLVEPPINFTLKRDLPRLGILYGDLDPVNIPLAQEVVGVKSVTNESDSGMV